MVFTAHEDGSVDYHGREIKEFNDELDSPFIPSGLVGLAGMKQYCFVIYRGLFGVYKIKECIVTSICFSYDWYWRTNNGWLLRTDELGKTVFKHDELQRAIEICEKKNRMSKVKIKYLH